MQFQIFERNGIFYSSITCMIVVFLGLILWDSEYERKKHFENAHQLEQLKKDYQNALDLFPQGIMIYNATDDRLEYENTHFINMMSRCPDNGKCCLEKKVLKQYKKDEEVATSLKSLKELMRDSQQHDNECFLIEGQEAFYQV